MRKTVPMQPADVVAWTEIARIAAKKLQDTFQRDKWAPPTQPAPDAWKNYEGPRNPYILDALLLHERMHAMYGYPYVGVPDECRVVSLMQNEGE